MHSSDIEIRSPAVSSMSISRAAGTWETPCGEPLEVVGRLAHRRDDDDDVVALPPGADDVLGDRLDAVGVGDRRAAVLLHEQFPHAAHGTGDMATPGCQLARLRS